MSKKATALQCTYNNLFQILMKLKCILKGILTRFFCYKEMSLNHESKVNRDRYNIDVPGCKKKAYMDLDFRTLNGIEIT